MRGASLLSLLRRKFFPFPSNSSESHPLPLTFYTAGLMAEHIIYLIEGGADSQNLDKLIE